MYMNSKFKLSDSDDTMEAQRYCTINKEGYNVSLLAQHFRGVSLDL